MSLDRIYRTCGTSRTRMAHREGARAPSCCVAASAIAAACLRCCCVPLNAPGRAPMYTDLFMASLASLCPASSVPLPPSQLLCCAVLCCAESTMGYTTWRPFCCTRQPSHTPQGPRCSAKTCMDRAASFASRVTFAGTAATRHLATVLHCRCMQPPSPPPAAAGSGTQQ